MIMANAKGLKFMYLNIRSLYKHHEELFLNCNNFDMILIGEIWLNSSICDNVISHPDYMLFRLDRQGPKRGGGLATYLRTNYGKYAYMLSDFNVSNENLEGMWIEIDVPNHKKMLLINIYRL